MGFYHHWKLEWHFLIKLSLKNTLKGGNIHDKYTIVVISILTFENCSCNNFFNFSKGVESKLIKSFIFLISIEF